MSPTWLWGNPRPQRPPHPDPKKKQPKKRPAAATTKSMAAGATSSATASALDPAVAGRNNAIKLGPISVTCAAEQAYLHKIDGKKRLVAACTKSKASTLTISHSEVIKKLLPFAELEGATKESVLRQRDIIFRDHAKPSM